MNVQRTILILVGALLLVGVSTAMDLSPSLITSGDEGGWMIANGVDNTTITVHVSNTLGPVPNANVTFSLDTGSQNLGTIDPTTVVTTGDDGLALATFTVAQKSGVATILATINVNDGITPPKTLSITQNIDHDLIHLWSYDTPSPVPVGSVTHLNITLTDPWGNRVDNKNPSETHLVTLIMQDPTHGAGFADGSGGYPLSTVTLPTDAFGNISVSLRMPTVAETESIQMQSIGSIATSQWINIEGDANKPAYLTQTYPEPNYTFADGVSSLKVIYTITDPYGNLVSGKNLLVNATDGLSNTFTTNDDGAVGVELHETKSGHYTIYSSSVDNASILCTNTGTIGYCSEPLEFDSTDPVALTLTASPQGMPSYDVDSTTSATLAALLTDVRGNPVIGQNVSFSIVSVTYPGCSASVTQAPSLSAASAITGGSGGYATVNFIPGAFATSGAQFNATATGQADVRATSTYIPKGGGAPIAFSQDITVVWKNYPYLSIGANADCSNAHVGDKIQLNLQITGNGTALRSKPIDVVLLDDRSGSMLEQNPDKEVAAKTAAGVFDAQLTAGKDRIGIISFADSPTNGWGQLTPSIDHGKWNWTNTYSTGYQVGIDDSGWNTYVSASNQGECPHCVAKTSFPYTNALTSYSNTTIHEQIVDTYYNNGNPKWYGVGSQYSTDLPFGYNTLASVNSAVNSIVPGGGTPTREAIYRAVNMLPDPTDPANAGRVRAIILLTDGSWNTGGDPEALTNTNPDGGTYTIGFTDGTKLKSTDSVIKYASDRNVMIFPIGLSVTSNENTTLARYAQNTNGTYYPASSGSELNSIYTAIAGQLNQVAGGSTTVDLDFQTVNINGWLNQSITDYMNYVYQNPTSTYVDMFNTAPNGTQTQKYTYVSNDTVNWTQKNMTFNVGDINLNDTWMTSFELNLTKAGVVTLFGPNSPATVTFKDSSSQTSQSTFINQLVCPILDNFNNSGFSTATIQIDGLTQLTASTPDPNVWALQWNTTYNGGDPTVQETITVTKEGSTTPLWVGYAFPSAGTEVTYTMGNPLTNPMIDARDPLTFPEGQNYVVTIDARATDSGGDSKWIEIFKAGGNGQNYIRLQ